VPPLTSAFGALLNHITGGHIISDDEPGKRSFQPMNVNFGLFPPLEPGRHSPPRRRWPFPRQGKGQGERSRPWRAAP
jgi:methylenetetrahydrofolate--tRNA-(uracil-5-)-methyltransferase